MLSRKAQFDSFSLFLDSSTHISEMGHQSISLLTAATEIGLILALFRTRVSYREVRGKIHLFMINYFLSVSPRHRSSSATLWKPQMTDCGLYIKLYK